jgi:MOSC domain-containing protein YiiM
MAVPRKPPMSILREHYPYFRELLGRPDLSPGFFGENLTAEGLLEDGVRVGENISGRDGLGPGHHSPLACLKLGAKVGSPAFVATFLNSRRLGFYLSVVEEGEVGAGDAIRRIGGAAEGPTLARLIEERYFREK